MNILTMALPLLTTLGLFLGVQYPSSVSAWAPRVIQSHRSRLIERPAPSQIGLSSAITTASSEVLSSAYDRAIPASIVGEAVRAALRSDRGICFDFSTNHYTDAASGADGSRLVSVVGLRGEGTKAFVNAKFSRSIPEKDDKTAGGGVQLSSSTKLVRMGHAFETAYLTPKGRMIDRLLVLAFPEKDEESEDAFLVTSPGNSGTKLYNELSKFVFPMDKVSLNDSTSQSSVITLACSSLRDAQTSFNNNILGLLMKDDSYSDGFGFPTDGVCHHYRVSGDAGSKTDVYVTKHTFLSEEISHGYTLLVRESEAASSQTVANQIWNNLTDELNDKGPVGVGALEYDTLRVEAGLPGYGEMSGDGPKKGKSQTEVGDERSDSADDAYYAKSSPLELHLQSLVDTEKGCYQGQEGVASILKNKRGCPRQLYQAVFYDDDNDFDGDGGGLGLVSIDNKELMEFNRLKKQAVPLPNDTRQPRPGDDVFVLGSSESIAVGKITSVAEPNGTGDAKTVALALVKRPGPILKAIKEQGLELPRWWEDADSDGEDDDARGPVSEKEGGSGIMQPPPLDPLHNLEIVIGGTYTVGRLVSVPSRRSKASVGDVAALLDYEQHGTVVDSGEAPAYFKYNFEDDQAVDAVDRVASAPVLADAEEEDENRDEVTDDLLAKAEEEAAKAAAEAEKAAAEAQRKEEKMKMLKARAEAAMAARRKKKESA